MPPSRRSSSVRASTSSTTPAGTKRANSVRSRRRSRISVKYSTPSVATVATASVASGGTSATTLPCGERELGEAEVGERDERRRRHRARAPTSAIAGTRSASSRIASAVHADGATRSGKPSRTVCSAFAWISAPDISRAPPSETAWRSCRVGAVGPTMTVFPANAFAGMSFSATRENEVVG